MRWRSFALRLIATVVVTVVVAFVMVLGLTIVDLYLVGHGQPSIHREILVWPRAGVRLSPSGVVLLASAAAAGAATWFLLRRAG